jgi:hypothetical protein
LREGKDGTVKSIKATFPKWEGKKNDQKEDGRMRDFPAAFTVRFRRFPVAEMWLHFPEGGANNGLQGNDAESGFISL